MLQFLVPIGDGKDVENVTALYSLCFSNRRQAALMPGLPTPDPRIQIAQYTWYDISCITLQNRD
jgi:hypothetical protein